MRILRVPDSPFCPPPSGPPPGTKQLNAVVVINAVVGYFDEVKFKEINPQSVAFEWNAVTFKISASGEIAELCGGNFVRTTAAAIMEKFLKL